jgi:hypothetical protein
MPQTLLDITDDLSALDDLLAENGGDVTDPAVAAAVDRWFAELDGALEAKADGYAALITTMRQRAEVRKAESDRLARRAKQDEASARFLADRLKSALEQRGVKKLETARFRIGVAGNGGLQPLDLRVPAEQLPEWARRTVVNVSADTEAIRRRLEAGERLEFANLMPRGTRLTIK